MVQFTDDAQAGWKMIRELLGTVAITGATISMAPSAAAGYDGDVPGMNYQASLGAPCDNYERFIFGRGPVRASSRVAPAGT